MRLSLCLITRSEHDSRKVKRRTSAVIAFLTLCPKIRLMLRVLLTTETPPAFLCHCDASGKRRGQESKRAVSAEINFIVDGISSGTRQIEQQQA
jgi:hypothetical protein